AEARRMIAAALEHSVTKFLEDAGEPENWDREGLRNALTMQYLVNVEALADAKATGSREVIVAAAQAEGEATFQRKVSYLRDFGQAIGVGDVDQQVLAQVMLGVIDEKWKDHLYDLDQLRNAIQYRAYGQKDPLVEYKKEAFEMFEDLIRDLRATFAERYLKIQVSAEPPAPPPPPRRQPVAPPPAASTDDLFAPPARTSTGPVPPPAPTPAPVVQSNVGRIGGQTGGNLPAVGRNDPCPC
ncbi:MAG: hypothetical protein JNL44_17210, partial [Gemmatimonadetes bacterium]|nr:hypothetical protein [Gemmatimonadota bacterium]